MTSFPLGDYHAFRSMQRSYDDIPDREAESVPIDEPEPPGTESDVPEKQD